MPKRAIASRAVDAIGAERSVVIIGETGTVSVHDCVGGPAYALSTVASKPEGCTFRQCVIPFGSYQVSIHTRDGWRTIWSARGRSGEWFDVVSPSPPLPHPSNILHTSTGGGLFSNALLFTTVSEPGSVYVWNAINATLHQVTRTNRKNSIVSGITSNAAIYTDGHVLCLSWGADGRSVMVENVGSANRIVYMCESPYIRTTSRMCPNRQMC